MKNEFYKIIAIIMPILLSPFFFTLSKANAQWVQQTITLNPGWNAVYLEIEPHPDECDEIFEDIPVKSVWTWDPQIATFEYIQHPNELLPKQPDWMVYFPPSSPERIVTNLYRLLKRRAYLIKLEGEQTVNLNITGRPCIPKIKWKQNSYNFVGFHLTPGQEPMFSAFFASSPAHTDQDIYRLNNNDTWEKVEYPAATPMQAGEAFWIYCKGASEYTGPLVCEIEMGGELEFGRVLEEEKFFIRNLDKNDIAVSLTTLNSEDPSDLNQPAVAGSVPLLYWKVGVDFSTTGWEPLPASLSFTIPAKQQKTLRLAVKRANMPIFGICQSILKIDNNAGMQILFPVSAIGSGGRSNSIVRRGKSRLRNGEMIKHAGLWLGNVIVNGVNQPGDPLAPNDPNKPTGSIFNFRMIIHVSEDGEVKLLREVVQMWRLGTTKPVDPNDPENPYEAVDEPGYFVLFTDESHIDPEKYTGSVLINGKLAGRRLSTAAFTFPGPISMDTGGSFSTDGEISFSITIEPDNPLNPYRHKYHPDHDNLNYDYSEFNKEEAYKIHRHITLQFTDRDPMISGEAEKLTGWGDTLMGGIYTERISGGIYNNTNIGLHRDDIYTTGYFYLQRISPIGYLNDEGATE